MILIIKDGQVNPTDDVVKSRSVKGKRSDLDNCMRNHQGDENVYPTKKKNKTAREIM